MGPRSPHHHHPAAAFCLSVLGTVQAETRMGWVLLGLSKHQVMPSPARHAEPDVAGLGFGLGVSVFSLNFVV